MKWINHFLKGTYKRLLYRKLISVTQMRNCLFLSVWKEFRRHKLFFDPYVSKIVLHIIPLPIKRIFSMQKSINQLFNDCFISTTNRCQFFAATISTVRAFCDVNVYAFCYVMCVCIMLLTTESNHKRFIVFKRRCHLEHAQKIEIYSFVLFHSFFVIWFFELPFGLWNFLVYFHFVYRHNFF